jgi:hemerythrin-like metal-binding protein
MNTNPDLAGTGPSNDSGPAAGTGMPAGLFRWSDAFLLGYPPMDTVHAEFVDLVGRLERATDAELAPLLEQFAAHTRAHFEMENTWMVETGFPPRECHIDEHAAVMKSVDAVRGLLAQGDSAVCRRLVQELIGWFPAHAHHLDSALAHWISKLRTGGKPVVIRRGLTLR